MTKRQWMAGITGAAIGAVAVAALSGTPGGAGTPPQDRAAVETIVHDYLLAHPEIIPEAMDRLRRRETAAKIDANRTAIETPFAGAWAGAKDGDVTLVEFFDYACGYCRTSVADVDRLLRDDPRLRIVFRELPILSDASDTAARVSLAAARQGRFLAFHRAMYAGDRPSAASIARAQAAAGLDAARATGDKAGPAFSTEIDTNLALARSLGLTGTPTFVVGDRLLSGAVGYDELKQVVADARARKTG